MGNLIKSHKKAFMCWILSFCVLFGILAPAIGFSATADVSDSKMLYFKTESTNKRLYQRAKVDVGETYYFSFALSTDVSFIPICRSDGIRNGINANVEQISAEQKGKCTYYTYSFTMPQEDNTGAALTDSVFFGIQITEASEGYFFSASLYNSVDSEKTELLANPDFKDGTLNEWAWDFDKWFRGNDAKLTEWSDSSTTLKVMNFDDSLIEEDNGDTVKALYIKTSESRKEIYQRAAVIPGETYVFSFVLSTGVEVEPICRNDGGRTGVNANITQVSAEEKSGYTKYVYTYTIPKKDNNGNDINERVFFGVRFLKAFEGNFMLASVYNQKDSDKKELFENPGFSLGVLDRWAWGWDIWFCASSFSTSNKGMTSWQSSNGATSLKIIDVENPFAEASEENSDKALYIKTSENRKEIYQRAEIKKGETYVFSFVLSTGVEVEPICRNDDGRYGINANITEVSVKEKSGYKKYVYTYTIPEKDNNGNDINERVFFGVRFLKAFEGTLLQTSVYNKNDADKTELLLNSDFKSGLDEWAWGWDAWFGHSSFKKGLQEWQNSNGTSILKITDAPQISFDTEDPSDPDEDKMLYVNTTRGKELYQRAAVQAGQTYLLTFSITDSVKDFKPVCNADGGRTEIDADIKLVNTEDKKGYSILTYSYTMPQTDKSGNSVTPVVFVGIKFYGTNEGYFFNASFKMKDSDTELLENPDFKVGLDEWAWGWDAWFRGTQKGLKRWNNDETVLEIVKLDESKFEESEPEVTNPKMLHINTTRGKEIMQRASVTVGKTYYFSFSLTDSVKYFNTVCLTDGSRKNIDADITLVNRVDKKGYKNYTYSYTIPEKDTTGGAVTSIVFIGIKLSGTQDGYFFNASFKADGNDSELFANPDFKVGLDEWAWGWDAWFRGNLLGQYSWSNEATTLTLTDIDDSIFSSGETATPKMLYIKSTAPKDLMQRVSAKAGEVYYFSFALTDSIKGFKMLCRSDDHRDEINAEIKCINEVSKNGYTVYTYSYKLPETYVDYKGNTVPITDLVFFGLRISTGCEGYLFDTSVCKADEKFKTELFENPDFTIGLDKWCWGWDAWFSHSDSTPAGLFTWSNDTTLLRIDNRDQKLIDKVIANMPGKKMIYYVNGATSSHFAARVEVETNTEYYMQFSLFSTAEVDVKVTKNGLRENIRDAQKELISTEEHGDYTTYLYKITMPEKLDDKLVFVGPVLRYYSEGYIFDMSFYRADDSKKKNLWNNPTFASGLDEWIWNWHAWFGSSTERGLFDWTNGANTVKVLDFDLKYIDALIAELNVNDGVWWDKDSVAEDTTLGIATLKGTIINKDNTPFKNIRLLLKSDSKSYETVTDSEGKFTFDKFTEGFYELYVTDANGNEVTTGFYYTFADGDSVTVNLVYDPNGNIKSGTVTGTVYTPQLKTVSGLIVYLGDDLKIETDEKGYFEFDAVPVGDYELYTVLPNGEKYNFRTVTVKEDVKINVKLKYDRQTSETDSKSSGNKTVLIGLSVAAAVLIAGGAVLLIFKRKRQVKIK